MTNQHLHLASTWRAIGIHFCIEPCKCFVYLTELVFHCYADQEHFWFEQANISMSTVPKPSPIVMFWPFSAQKVHALLCQRTIGVLKWLFGVAVIGCDVVSRSTRLFPKVKMGRLKLCMDPFGLGKVFSSTFPLWVASMIEWYRCTCSAWQVDSWINYSEKVLSFCGH